MGEKCHEMVPYYITSIAPWLYAGRVVKIVLYQKIWSWSTIFIRSLNGGKESHTFVSRTNRNAVFPLVNLWSVCQAADKNVWF